MEKELQFRGDILKSLKYTSVFLGILIFGLILFYGLGNALFPLIFSAMAAYLLYPLFSLLERNKITRRFTVIVIIFLLMILFLFCFLVILPLLIKDLQQFLLLVPEYVKSFIVYSQDISKEYDIPLYWDTAKVVEKIKEYIQNISLNTITVITSVLQNTLTTIMGILIFFMNLFLFPLFFYYLSTDYQSFINFFDGLISPKYKSSVYYYIDNFNKIVSGYIRGQLIVVMVEMLIYSLGLTLIGLPFGTVVGICIGALTIIPYAGPFIGYSTCIIIILATNPSWIVFSKVTAIFGFVISLENFFLMPNIVGDKVGLDPLLTIITLVIFGNYFGLIGIIFAIPLGGMIKFVIMELINKLHENYRVKYNALN